MQVKKLLPITASKSPSPAAAMIPIGVLILGLVAIVYYAGAGAIADYAPVILLSVSALAFIESLVCGTVSRRSLRVGFTRSARQILPTVPMLICIAMISTAWMASGVVPTLVDYGLQALSPQFFLATTCAVAAVVSVVTGSSWTTIATIGIAFMGIGTTMGYSPGWIAGAVISGAYFGDKVSPLSDTTVLASSTCGVDIFTHIRYLMVTTVPAMIIALVTFVIVGCTYDLSDATYTGSIASALAAQYQLSPFTLLIPLSTIILIALRVPSLPILFAAAVAGVIGIYVFQGHNAPDLQQVPALLWHGNDVSTGSDIVDCLVATGGISGITSIILLVLSAMVFGAVMMGTGMLATLSAAITTRLRKRTSIVGTTLGSGVAMNICSADQYLAIILTGNMYRHVYRRFRLENRLLSRTLEDSVSVTSVLVPWNSCGITQATVLSVPTFEYLPYCVFNYVTPVVSVIVAWSGYRIVDAVMPRKVASAPCC